MNIKNLVKVAKVVAVVMVGVVSGCASMVPVNTKFKAEALQVETVENAQKIEHWRKKINFNVRKPAGTSLMYYRTANGVFGGGKWNYNWAIVPPGTAPMPKAGDFVEISSGDGSTVETTFVRILPADCGWRGLAVTGQRVGCD